LETYLKRLGYSPIRLETGDNNNLFVHGRVNGKRERLELDTGCGITRLVPKAARSLQALDPSKTEIDDGFLNELRIPGLVRIDELVLDSVHFQNQPAEMGELEFDFVRVLEQGLLGCDFFFRNHSIIDCRHGQLFVRAAALAPEEKSALGESLRRSGFGAVELSVKPGLPATCRAVANGKPVGLVVDTGSPWSLLDWDTGKQLSLPTLMRPQHLELTGIGKVGTHGLQEAQLQTLQLGDVTLNRIYIGLADMSAWGLTERGTNLPSAQGLLGMETLASTSALIDFGSLKIWLRPSDPK